MPAVTVTLPPGGPSLSDLPNFDAEAEAFVLWLESAIPQLNAQAVQNNADAATSTTQAGVAQSQVAIAAASASAAAASAISAVNAPGTSGTSTTSNTIGTGTKTFTTQTGKNFVVGQKVTVARTSAPDTTSMFGTITAYNSGTGSISIAVTDTAGAGTFTDWTIGLSGPPGTVSGSGLVISQNSSSPNGTIPVSILQASGAATHIDVALAPKGDGAILVDLPDNASTGGNKRGANAVDLQVSRNAATSVASGAYSAIVASFNSLASGSASFVGAGQNNDADGFESSCVGGNAGSARGLNRVQFFGCGVGGGGLRGERQRSVFTQRFQATSATPVVLTADGNAASSTNQVVMPNNSTYLVCGQLTARQSAGAAGVVGDSAGWTFAGTFKRGANAAATSVVGTVTVTKQGAGDTNSSTWALTLTADTTFGCPKLTFTGQASKTIELLARIDTTEIA